MGESYKISIIPNTSLWMKLGRTKYTIPKALSELIDNSIDNKEGEKVNVDIHFAVDGDYIGILDDAKGMDIETLTRALTIAEHIEDGEKIGEHGFGLEAASSYLGKNLIIYTKTSEMNECLKFYYNQQEFLEKNEWTVDYEYISKESLNEETGLSFDRGTYIRIENLNVRLYNGLVATRQDTVEGTMVTKFQSIYKKFIEKGILNLQLHVERKRGTVDHITIESPVQQQLTFKVNYNFVINNNGKELKVKGWAGVLDFYDENIKNKKKYTSGFDIISKNKVILQHIHLGYSYHPEKRLVLGEIELENFQTTSDKTDFIRNSDWQALELTLNQYIIKPILHIASTAYLNNIAQKVANEEDFDLNLDFERMLRRCALNDESQGEFDSELLPATLTSKVIEIEESKFDESKEEIIEYMQRKNAYEEEKRRAQEMEDNIIDEVLGGTDIFSQNESFEQNVIDENREPVENEDIEIDFNITFNHNGLVITHKLDTIASSAPYTFEYNQEKGTLTVTSNSTAYNGLYANMEAYCTINIINAIADTSIMVTSEECALDAITLSRIKGAAINTFRGDLNIFRKYNNISA